MSNQFVVRWIDRDGQSQSKVYLKYDDASKAYKWLLKNGAESVDLAIKPNAKKPIEVAQSQYKD